MAVRKSFLPFSGHKFDEDPLICATLAERVPEGATRVVR